MGRSKEDYFWYAERRREDQAERQVIRELIDMGWSFKEVQKKFPNTDVFDATGIFDIEPNVKVEIKQECLKSQIKED